MMSYSIYEKLPYYNSQIHTIFHNLRFTPDPSDPKPVMHWHENIELIYVVEGACSIEYDTSCTLVSPGELAIIHCNENHKVQPLAPLIHYYCLIISPLDYCFFPFSLEYTHFERIIKKPSTLDLLLQVVVELNTHPKHFQYGVKLLITQLIIELLRHHIIDPQDLATLPSSNDPKLLLVQKVIFYIRTHFTENLSLEQLSLQIGVSKSYLCHIFKEVTHKTIIQYINELKCQYAQRLIKESDYTLTQIIEKCGFNSVPYFYRIYKKHIGLTPSNTHTM